MNPQVIIEAIKTIIKMQVQNEPNTTLSSFTKKKDVILSILGLMNNSFNTIDSITLNSYYDVAVKEYISVYPVDIDPSSSLVKKGHRTWLTDERKMNLPKDYINRYLTHLANEGRSEKVIEELSRSSEVILGKLGDPQSDKSFYVKGLVVGSVQSGKTGNFNAVINRAVDAGYNLIIILSGIMEDLRSQTQLRLEKDVIGEGTINIDTDQQDAKGVGKIKRFGIQGRSEVPQVFSITSHKSDFKRQIQDANFSLNQKNILVCKKNTGILKNLLIWLSDYLHQNKDQHDIPLLIVDDEADNASLNNLGHKGREYASKINGHIRAILALFSKKTYLGYTATPFANVLQDRNEEADGLWSINYKRNGETITRNFNQVPNIFPDDFIELLTPPTNYIGAPQIFTTIYDEKKIPLIEPINDFNDCFPQKVVDDNGITRPATGNEILENKSIRSPKSNDHFPIALPDSMKDAIECFILTIAIRLKRRPAMAGSILYNPHNTMLIHVSRFTEWQNKTAQLVQSYVNILIEKITTELPSSPLSVYSRLEKNWNKYYAAIIDNIRTYLPDRYTDSFLEKVTFEEIKPLLPETVKGMQVKAINSATQEKLIYTTDANGNGKKYIAIGGNRLSRGFTLEGLTINYFIRDTNYADTLLQMGRWFGYRPGYIDCCKLFTTWDAISKYDAATRTIGELELEFKKMNREGKTPEDFILRVRTHPGVIKITRPSILKNTDELNWSYSNTLEQTTQFELKADRINNAWIDLKKLIKKFNWEYRQDLGFYYIEVGVAELYLFLDIANTFHEYTGDIEQIKTYINLCAQQDKIKKWRIGIKKNGLGSNLPATASGLPGEIRLSLRSGPKTRDRFHDRLVKEGVFTGSGKSANIVSSLDMALWLEKEEIEAANLEFETNKMAELIEKHKIGEEEARTLSKKTTKPEGIYRRKMSDKAGLMVIYLMDLAKVLPNNDEALSRLKEDRKINTDIPLIGYAMGFPELSVEIGGTYVKGKHNRETDEPESDEPDEAFFTETDE